MAASCNLKTEGINVKLVAIAKIYNVAWWILEDTGHLFPQLNSWQHSGQSHQACKTFISDDELSKSTTHQIISTIIRALVLVATEGNGNNCHNIPYLHCTKLPTLSKISTNSLTCHNLGGSPTPYDLMDCFPFYCLMIAVLYSKASSDVCSYQ